MAFFRRKREVIQQPILPKRQKLIIDIDAGHAGRVRREMVLEYRIDEEGKLELGVWAPNIGFTSWIGGDDTTLTIVVDVDLRFDDSLTVERR